MNRQPRGVLIVRDPARARAVEIDTVLCCHCQAIVALHDDAGAPLPADQVGGFCRLCMRTTCPRCAAHGTCTPFEQRLEAAERRDRDRRASAAWGD